MPQRYCLQRNGVTNAATGYIWLCIWKVGKLRYHSDNANHLYKGRDGIDSIDASNDRPKRPVYRTNIYYSTVNSLGTKLCINSSAS